MPLDREKNLNKELENQYQNMYASNAASRKVQKKSLKTPEELLAERNKRLLDEAAKQKAIADEESKDQLQDNVDADAPAEEKVDEAKERAEIEEKKVAERLARERAIQANMREQHKELIGKIDKLIEEEKSCQKKAFALKQAYYSSKESAVAIYGAKADLAGINDKFKSEMDSLNPKVKGVSDIVSAEIDNALHGDKNTHIIMSNGSIRVVDSQVAKLMSERRVDLTQKKDVAGIESIDELNKDHGAAQEAVDDAIEAVDDTVIDTTNDLAKNVDEFDNMSYADQLNGVRLTDLEKQRLDELSDLMVQNSVDMNAFEREIDASYTPDERRLRNIEMENEKVQNMEKQQADKGAEMEARMENARKVREREERLLRLGASSALITWYVDNVEITRTGRMLPNAMYSAEMRRELSGPSL